MTGLDGVETVAKVTGGYGKLQLDEKILDLRRETLEGNQIPEENAENREETAPKLMNLWQNRSVIPIWKN